MAGTITSNFTTDDNNRNVNGQENSDSGDALMSCIDHMGINAQRRAQSIVFATDNEHYEQIHTVTQAATIAKEAGVRVYSVAPAWAGEANSDYTQDEADKVRNELRQASLSTDGQYYALESISIPEVIDNISTQEATFFAGSPVLSESDRPAFMIIISLSFIVLLAITIGKVKE
jgi:hypothetical protein